MSRTIPSSLPGCRTVHVGVSSSDQHKASYISPLSFHVPPEVAWRELRQRVTQWPRTEVVKDVPGYLKVLTHSLILRLPDEVEFLLDTHHACICICSVSKVLPYDFGSNRRRIEKLRLLLAERLAQHTVAQ
ncbi:MAG: DUF1499 domain-containing protein [Plesiomonas sp.]